MSVHGEDSGIFSATAVTYGDQPMVKVIDRVILDGSSTYVAAFVLNDAGIKAATSAAITVTWSVTPRGSDISSAFLANVEQAAPTMAKSGNETTSAKTLSSPALASSSGDLLLLAASAGSDATYSVDNGFTERFETTSRPWGDAIAGSQSSTGASVAPSVTQSQAMRQVLIGFVVQHSP